MSDENVCWSTLIAKSRREKFFEFLDCPFQSSTTQILRQEAFQVHKCKLCQYATPGQFLNKTKQNKTKQNKKQSGHDLLLN